VRQAGEPVWMPEIGLGIGRYRYECWGTEQELLMWFDPEGQVHGIPEVTREELLREQRRTEREQRRAEREQRRADELERSLDAERRQSQRLADYLRSLGVDPDHLPEPNDRN